MVLARDMWRLLRPTITPLGVVVFIVAVCTRAPATVIHFAR